MNLDSLSFALSQISYAVAGLTKKNFKANIVEISNLVSAHGSEADRHLYRCLFSHIDFASDVRSGAKDTHQIQYLIQECPTLIGKPNFVSTLCYALDNPLHQQKSLRPSPQLFTQLSKVLRLSCVQEVAFGLAALRSSNADTRKFVTQFVRQKLPQLLTSYIETVTSGSEGGGLRDTPIEILHLVLSNLLSVSDRDTLGVSNEQRDSFFRALCKEFPRERVPVVLAPLLYRDIEDIPLNKLNPDSTTMSAVTIDSSLADMIQEHGYPFTKSVDQCRSTLVQFGVKYLTPASVARVLSMMARQPSGSTEHLQAGSSSGGPVSSGMWPDSAKDSASSSDANSWKVDIFVQVVRELTPSLSWSDVVKELDHPGFMISSKTGLSILVQGIFLGVNSTAAFPIQHLYAMWKNKEGQMSWIVHAIKNPEVFCFAEFPHRPVNTDCLKSLPDEENRDVAIWKSMELVDLLLQLSDEGHYQPCLELFKYPITHCPDLLLLALLQLQRWNAVKREMVAALIPTFLGNHPNSAPVLQFAWHCQTQSPTIRTLVLNAMAEWYMRGEQHDQARLSRILDVSQDLKALSMLLNAPTFAFVIDLACLASRREYLKLDKWINDKTREHGESFISACVQFLQCRVPQLIGGAPKEDMPQTKSQQLPVETISTMLTCMQACIKNLSPELQDAVLTLVTNANLLMKSKQGAMSVGGVSGLMPGGSNPTVLRTGMQPPHQLLPGLGGMSSNMNSQISRVTPTPLQSSGYNTIDPLVGLGALGLNPSAMNNPNTSGLTSSGYAPGLGGLGNAPGSPAKSYTPLGGGGSLLSSGQLGGGAGQGLGQMQQSQQYNSMQAFTSQLQGMSMHSGLGTGLPTGMAPSLGPGLGSGLGPSLGSNLGPGLGSSLMPGLGSGLSQNMGGPSLVGGGGGLGQSIGTGLGTGFGTSLAGGLGSMGGNRGAPSLGALSTQAALGQQQRVDSMRRVNQASELTNIFPTQNQGVSFSKDVEDEANSYFQRIYNSSASSPHPAITIEQTLEMLKKFKDSSDDRERDVFQCMLRNLFEEYRFFPQYPDKELATTAILFGGIIENGLVTYMALGVALRYILEALKKPQNSKMYIFGLTALDRCKTKLKEYPQYCQFLASIPHFSDFPASLKEYIEYGSRSMEVPGVQQRVPAAPSVMPAVAVTAAATVTTTTTSVTTTVAVTSAPAAQTTHGAISRPSTSGAAPSRASIANATNIDTLLANKEGTDGINVPAESLQDKVFFIFNNLSQANMDQKASELTDSIGEEFMPWVAQYMVMKRASIEHNFHTLYANFIDHLKTPDLIKMVVKETFRNIKVLLRSDKGVANFSDRTLLKNLGHWLGMLTLAKNKPILYVDIDLKSLIYEAYHKGAQELLYVVPFVAKIIESAIKSKVFMPPNPWTMGIMNVLGELHREQDIRLNLKFEIEVLCKHLQIDVNELMPTQYLKDLQRGETIEHQLSTPTPPGAAATGAGGVAAGFKPKETTTATTPQPDEPLQINMPTPTSAILAASATPAASAASAYSMAPAIVSSPPGGGITAQQQQPQFAYNDIQINSPTGLKDRVFINEQIPLLQAHPQLKTYVKPAIERAVQELLAPTIDRAMKIAINTSEQIVKKDFALDPDESRMRSAAHHLVRFMTAGMALITVHEPVHMNISNQLKSIFLTQIRATTQQQKDMIEQAAHMLASDNTELATNFIQKTAVEKAIPEIDKRLANDYELRKHARAEGRRYCDPVVLTYQAERMPEQIRLKVGGVTPQQSAIYEEFTRNIPGFMPAVAATQEGGVGARAGQAGVAAAAQQPMGAAKPLQVMGVDDIQQVYEKIARDIEQHLHAFLAVPNSQQMSALRTLLEYVLLARNSPRDHNAALALLQRAVDGLLEGLSMTPGDTELILRYRDCHVMVLRAINDPRLYGPAWTTKQVTRCLIECREEYRYNIDAVECLVLNQLVIVQQYDQCVAQSIDNVNVNYMALGFAMQLIQRFCASTSSDGTKHGRLQEGDFIQTIDALARVASMSRQPPEGLTALLDAVRQHNGGDVTLLDRTSVGPTSMMHSGITQAREFDDPPGLNEKTEYLLRDWVTLYHSPAAGRDSAKAFSAFVAQMHAAGILKTDDLITRFFRLCTEMCVDLCYRTLADQNQGSLMRTRVQCFHTLDAFVRLIALLLKHSGDNTNTVTKINLLNKVLGIVVGVLLQDHDIRRTEFQQLPYHRIFIILFIELNAPEPILESINFEVLQAFCNTLHILRPSKAPGFSYAWLELVSHRDFIGRMLARTPQQRAWGMYAQLLIDLFKFLAPFLRNADLTRPTQLLYKGTMRVLLVLLHDFPEFLCDYHYAFCDVIPPNCIQVRNLILSAFPRNMRLPDPFTPNLKVDVLPEIVNAPRIMTNFVNLIQPVSFKKVSNTPGMKYNVTLMNALVLHVGTQAIAHISSKGLTPSMGTIAHSSHMDIFQNLAVDLDTEGRYLFLNAVANQLRYPNSHTHYFSCTLLYLFAEANSEAIQEQITRVLLERLIVNRPHPWGLLITFIELIKNPIFKFWGHEFVHCAPEIEKLLDSVARSCMPQKPNIRGGDLDQQDSR